MILLKFYVESFGYKKNVVTLQCFNSEDPYTDFIHYFNLKFSYHYGGT